MKGRRAKPPSRCVKDTQPAPYLTVLFYLFLSDKKSPVRKKDYSGACDGPNRNKLEGLEMDSYLFGDKGN